MAVGYVEALLITMLFIITLFLYSNIFFFFCALLVCLHYRILGGKTNQFPVQKNNLFDFNESVDVKPHCSILFSVVCEKEKGNTA